MVRRVPASALGLLLVAPLTVACSVAGLPGGHRAATPPPPPRPAYGPPYVDSLPPEATTLPDPSGACRSSVPAGTSLAPPLQADQVVVAAFACGHVTSGHGAPRVVTRQAGGVVLSRLVAALRLPSAKTHGICDASARTVPAFAVHLKDGRWISPEVPSDGCHQREQVLTALRGVLEQP